MVDTLEKVVRLREEKNIEEAITLCKKVLEREPNNPEINYQCAWCHDLLELEREAIPYYEKAIKNGLKDEDLEGAYLGLGSTYRTIGEYKDSLRVFEEGMEGFPKNKDLEVFYAMTLYNLKRYDEAMEILLKIIATTSEDEKINAYKKAILYYSDKLDKIF